ncbi:PREDICTED: uncharacterized protein LOC108564494 isoform X2 [Nicrophorus vespilloides]|uniref:Uncharacterized protein LOC108564494 isoform X2 n=1 Tax=Nicrophorus vespilloides TaxID=110193 RepID=A0ABM1MWV0_NICVS|nr:PREDICTED: uncharacterized protein LOC108564494 isoform X2 [Nicrophorus vespilloides]
MMYRLSSMDMAKMLLISLIVFGVIQAGGAMSLRTRDEGDPAPGRSPGPPRECRTLDGAKRTDRPHYNLTISHNLFSTDLLVSGVTYQVTIERNGENEPFKGGEFMVSSSLDDGSLWGTFSGFGPAQGCGPPIYKSQFGAGTFPPFALNWTTNPWNLQLNSLTATNNVTFTLKYRLNNDMFKFSIALPISEECQLWLRPEEKLVSWVDFPSAECQVWFPGHRTGHGLVIDMHRLNIPCTKGFLHFSGLNTSQQQHFRSHKQAHLCGKLEELPDADRHIYFPSSHSLPYLHIRGSPVFTFFYHLVDYCYNVTFVTRNGSFELKPTASGDLQCTFKIYLPYGNRVALSLVIGDKNGDGKRPEVGSSSVSELNNVGEECVGLRVEFVDGDGIWSHCSMVGEADRRIEIVSRENKVVLKVRVRTDGGGGAALGMRLSYRAEAAEDIVGMCGFGWVALRQFCVSAVEDLKLPWAQAELECGRRGGHLASIRNEHAQTLIDNLLLNSPGYKDNNAYWIGASDKTHEGDFHWSDGLPFSYTNWFPGWSQHGDYNRQPNDDGLSEQDCVEVRRIYSLPTSSASLASTFMWNDRDCSAPNFFICERLQNDEPLEEVWPPDCNRSVILSPQQPRAAVSSPGFPRQYPDNADCDTIIAVPPGYRIILDFEELVLENEPSCSYDYLEIIEMSGNATNGGGGNSSSRAGGSGSISSGGIKSSSSSSRRLCGDWSSKLKLLRHVSSSSKLRLHFSSDYSHHFGGFKARVSMENALQCSDDRLQIFNNSCYLFVSYPEVMWSTAQQICKGIRAQLASILTPDEERFVTTNIRKTSEYRNSAKYWLGGKVDSNGKYNWIDGSNMGYFGWLPGQGPSSSSHEREEDVCLGIQWTYSPTPMLPSGLYWKSQKCNSVGGYICKRPTLISGQGINFNKTVNGSEGKLVTPNYPGNYYNNLDFTVRIVGPERTRIVIQFDKLDIESQIECLYDYVEMRTVGKNGRAFRDSVKWCGSHETEMQRFNFVAENNEVQLRFHSDYSITGGGFLLHWHSVDISGCPIRTLTAKEGFLVSPNYPHFLLAHLDCTFNIIAPPGKRIWLNFERFDMDDEYDESSLEVNLGTEGFKPFQTYDLLTDGTYVSNGDRMKVRLRTHDKPRGSGFKAAYKITPAQELVINLTNNSIGNLLYLNYPNPAPRNVEFKQHLIAPFGYVISLELSHLILTEVECGPEFGTLEVLDNYADTNGTSWHMCYDTEVDSVVPKAPIAITSFLNTLHIRQRHARNGLSLNGTLRVEEDVNFMDKIMKHKSENVESCKPNPCLNEGKCVHNGSQKLCQCLKYYTGIFCALTQCDLDPCVFGSCQLTENSFKCHCKLGYMGPTCEQKRRPCEGNPCEGRGTCVERGADGFLCRCHAWWEGTRCERRMLHIPYKPLSERMLREPFWLGLMTVSVVMGVIGLFWCAKRHFPEKIEKLLAEEEDRNRGGVSSLRSSSVREQLAASGAAAVSVTPSPGPGAPRSLFGRLGIRKPSILSLTSPHASGYSPATARTFSLDDLLKPPPRRTPSPKKKRNNSTPTKKNAAEKKQILQQLISPGGKGGGGKVSLGELMQMSERSMKEKKKDGSASGDDASKETKFGADLSSAVAVAALVPSAQLTLSDPKLEKKVTFARLLSKVSQEMSSGSEMELGIMQANRLSCAFARPSSTPPSPGANARSPNSTSSNQGSDSLTSSDLAIPSSSSISDLARRKQTIRQKPSSADSILAMFRNFSATNPATSKLTPSTTPSSPMEDDESTSTSSIHTPISLSSSNITQQMPESPVFQHGNKSTIEVSVLDTLSAHKSSSSGSNFLHPPTILLEIPSTISKCLSPIRELPTPLPSPAVTPCVVRRSAAPSSPHRDTIEFSDHRMSVEIANSDDDTEDDDEEEEEDEEDDGQDDGDNAHNDDDDEDEEEEEEEEDEQIHQTEIAIDPHAEDGLILEEAAAMQSPSSANRHKIKNRPPPLGQILHVPTISIISDDAPSAPLVIPMVTIQTPSPTRQRPTSILLPGSPPPRSYKDTFQFPTQSKSKRMLKEFDKPTSLDLPCAPPLITITCNMSEAESDAESISPNKSATLAVSTTGMTYLSPFSMVSRGDHNASESNLSSSGYSSMASPGPSRCGSSNPLCPSEMEDPPGPSSSLGRRPSPLLKSNNTDNTSKTQHEQRGRSDSETLSDDVMMESNDEGIGTDHIEEKIDDGQVKSAKELEVFLSETKNCLQPPAIIVHSDSNNFDKMLSPVSSRSESPLSDRTNRFSAQFYGRNKDLLPFTDSDGLYDFPSSDKVNVMSLQQPHRKAGRKRDKKLVRQSKTPSPTKPSNQSYLELPIYKLNAVSPRKPSPKRRLRNQQQQQQQAVTSSSSSDSIESTIARDHKSSSSPSPETIRCWATSLEWPKRSPEASGEETGDEANCAMLAKFEPEIPKHRKIGRLRAISNQIRFLRRLEVSLKRRERIASPSESGGEDSPRATSPLLQGSSESKIGMIGSRNRRGRLKEETWKRAVATANGHSD